MVSSIILSDIAFFFVNSRGGSVAISSNTMMRMRGQCHAVLGIVLLCLCTASAFRAPDCSAAILRRRNALHRPPPRLPLASSACGSSSSAAGSAAARRETAQSRRRVLGFGLSLVTAGALAAGAPSEARAICGSKPQSWEFWIPVRIVTLFNDSHCRVARDRVRHVCVAADAVPGCSAIRIYILMYVCMNE